MAHSIPHELDGERVDKVVAVLGKVSRSQARLIVECGEVLVNGVVASARGRVDTGSEIAFEIPETGELLIPEQVDFGVVYEDEHLVVVDKPAGLVTHPGAGHVQKTLAGGLLYRYPEIRGVGEDPRWGIVHRLDKDTSGLLVVAKTSTAHLALSEMVARHEIDRQYLALVDALFDAPRGTIDAPIGSDPTRGTRKTVTPFGRPSRTHYRRSDDWPAQNATLLEVTLETGRTHQIRVHLATIGHPVIGDRWYGKPTRASSPRVFLHASGLAFVHPITGDPMDLHSPLPEDLASVISALTASKLAEAEPLA